MAKLKLVKNFPNRAVAEQAQALLATEANIESIIQSIDFGITGTGGASFPQGADLLVEESNYERAYRLLYDMFNGI